MSAEYLNEAAARSCGSAPHAALAAWHLGLADEARAHGEAALALAPDDERLAANVGWYRA